MQPDTLAAIMSTDNTLPRERVYGSGAVARMFGVQRRDVSDLFYQGRLNEHLCPIILGRRVIPANYIPMIAMALHRAGKIASPRPEVPAND